VVAEAVAKRRARIEGFRSRAQVAQCDLILTPRAHDLTESGFNRIQFYLLNEQEIEWTVYLWGNRISYTRNSLLGTLNGQGMG
jgi:hypothetical protein